MPPKPRIVVRKPSQTVNPEQAKSAASKMPPPQISNIILHSELNALETSYKDIAIATGKLFQFYADSRKERIATYSPYPPVSIARMLGRSLEKYDQICDTIETRLQHAIAVIQRDIRVIKSRLEAEAEESARKPVFSSSTTPALLASPIDQPSMSMDATLSNLLPLASSMQNRRQSAILSSLHRPGLPLKLDMSSLNNVGSSHSDPTFATPVDVSIDLGLTRVPSPVTLAPKTSKTLTHESTLDLFINPAHQSIPELSMDTENSAFNPSNLSVSIPDKSVIDLTSNDPASREQLGDSADKPIELDLDTSYDDMDLFGDGAPTPRDSGSAQTIQENGSANMMPLPHNLDENLNKLLMDAPSQTDSLKDTSMSLHEEMSSSQLGNDTSIDTFRPLEESRRFSLTNLDFSTLTGLFNNGNGTAMPQPNESSNEDLDLMSQLLAIEGNSQTNGP